MWAETDGERKADEVFARCVDKLPDNPCVREIFFG